jgi:cytochrome b
LRYDPATRLIHVLLATVGIAALVSGQFAGDYRHAVHVGFDVHRWIGIVLAVVLGARLVWGFIGPAGVRFVQWLPVTPTRLRAVRDDVGALLRLRLPAREGHEGIAGCVQAIGLGAFVWVAATGTLMWIYLEPGARATGWLHTVKELHEAGQPVLLAYLAVHVGAVVAHSIAGHPVWPRMALWTRDER